MVRTIIKTKGYKIIKYCRRCKKRYTVPSGKSWQVYCEECDKIRLDDLEKFKR